jgi:uncharacterized protein (TIGR02145 family)
MKENRIIIFILMIIFSSCTDEEKLLYEEAKATNSSESYQNYLNKYHNGKYIVEIKDSLKLRLEEEHFFDAKQINTLESYSNFIESYSNSRFQDEILDSIYFFKEIIAFDSAFKKMKIEYFQIVIDSFTNGRYLSKAQFYIDSLQKIIAEEERKKIAAEKEKQNNAVAIEIQEDESDVNTVETGTFIDNRDGRVYKTVKIGNQWWMSENLAYKANGGCWAYEQNSSNVSKYGYLYNWETAKKVCPAGWHLPSNDEWNQLAKYINNNNQSGPRRKGQGDYWPIAEFLKSTTGWGGNCNGNDEFGFNALPGGIRYDNGRFFSKWHYGFWWSSTQNSSGNPWYRYLQCNAIYFYSYYYRNDYGINDGCNKAYGLSVRCVMD